MTDEAVIDVLTGGSRPAPVGVTWLPEEALDALFWGKASGPAEALGALAENVPLDFAFVPASADWAEQALAALPSAGALPVWTVDGPLGRVEDKLGALETLRMSSAEPAKLAAIIDRELHAALDDVRRGSSLGIRALVVADDLAGEQGPLVSPDYALEALMPCYRRLAEQAIALNAIPAFHSDGDIRSLVPALARVGYAAIHPGGLGAEKLAPLAETAWANGLVVIGGLHGRGLLAGARSEATAAVSLSRQGPMLVADDGGISSAEELAAFVTAIRAVRSSLGAIFLRTLQSASCPTDHPYSVLRFGADTSHGPQTGQSDRNTQTSTKTSGGTSGARGQPQGFLPCGHVPPSLQGAEDRDSARLS